MAVAFSAEMAAARKSWMRVVFVVYWLAGEPHAVRAWRMMSFAFMALFTDSCFAVWARALQAGGFSRSIRRKGVAS